MPEDATTPRIPIDFQSITDIIESVDDLPFDRVPPKSAMILRPERRPGQAGGLAKKERFATRKNRYRAAMQRACAASDWKEICQKAVADAKLGDKAARTFLAEYLLGKPGAVDSDGVTNVGSLQVALFGKNMPRASSH